MSYRLILVCFILVFGLFILKRFQTKSIRNLERVLQIAISKRQYGLICVLSLPYLVNEKLIFLMVVGYVYPIVSAKRYEKTLKLRLRYEFSIWMRNLSVYLKHNTVYHSILKTRHLVPKLFEKDVEVLIALMEKNPHNRDAYLGFMSRYDHYDIQYMMKQLYRYASISSTDAQDQLLRMVTNANAYIQKSRVKTYNAIITSRHWIGFLPLLLVSLVFMILMFVLMGQILGGGWIT